MKNKMPLDMYDFFFMTKEKQQYIVLYGRHFNKALYEYAASAMRKKNKQTGEEEKVPVFQKEEVDNILKKYNVNVENKGDYDYVYIAQMCRADFLGESVPDEQRLALYVKNKCDDVDAPDELILREWCTKQDAAGNSVPWEEFY